MKENSFTVIWLIYGALIEIALTCLLIWGIVSLHLRAKGTGKTGSLTDMAQNGRRTEMNEAQTVIPREVQLKREQDVEKAIFEFLQETDEIFPFDDDDYEGGKLKNSSSEWERCMWEKEVFKRRTKEVIRLTKGRKEYDSQYYFYYALYAEASTHDLYLAYRGYLPRPDWARLGMAADSDYARVEHIGYRSIRRIRDEDMIRLLEKVYPLSAGEYAKKIDAILSEINAGEKNESV